MGANKELLATRVVYDTFCPTTFDIKIPRYYNFGFYRVDLLVLDEDELVKMIQKPYTLVELPKNPIAPNGRTFASDIYALVGSKKRKRSELAIALDNESINIYDVYCNSHAENE